MTDLELLLNLKWVNIRETKVFKLEWTKDLNLDVLDISATRVKDLSALARMISLVQGARQNPSDFGLRFTECALDDERFRSLATFENPERTEKVFDLLDPAWSSKLAESVVQSPQVPRQGHGPHFVIKQGKVEFAPSDELDSDGNHVARIRALQPILVGAARGLVASLETGNVPHFHLNRVAQKYMAAISEPTEKLNFSLIYGYGIQLQRAFESTEKAILDNDAPNFSVEERGQIESLLELHGPFVSASTEGLQLLSESKRYQQTELEMTQERGVTQELARVLSEKSGVLQQDVAEFLEESAASVGEGRWPERAAVFGSLTLTNIVVVVLGAGVFYFEPASQVVLGVVAAKAFENSAIGKGSVDFLKKFIDLPLEHENSFRKFAAEHPSLQFVHHVIDWMKAR